MQLILEIKPHKSILNEQRAVDATLKLVKKMKMEKQVEYISFSKYICSRIHQFSPSSKIAYLDAKMTPDEIKAEGWTGLDYYYNAIKKNPEWIEQSKKNGISVNVWTVDKSEDLQYFIDKGVDYITTNNPVEALKLAK
jgi:Glycerophosphoryl diester phosphodiesterase